MKNHFKYLILGIFVVLIYISFLLIKPFIVPILTSFVVAYLFYPFYKWMEKRIENKMISSILVSVIIILLITIPGFLVLQTLTKEAYVTYFIAKQKIFDSGINGNLFEVCKESESVLCSVISEAKNYWRDPQFQYYLQDGIKKMADFTIETISVFIFTIPRRILDIFIIFFMIYYLFKDGDLIIRKLKELIPLKKKHQDLLYNKIKSVSYAIVFGSFVVALIQGALGTLGFYIFGIPSPILWGIVMAFFAFLPFMIGTAIVWVPAGLILLFDGYLAGNPDLIWKGIGLLLYGSLVISTVDNFIRPKIIGNKGKTHPIIILIGVFGGLALFGFIGIVIGPLILAILLSFAQIYVKEM